MVVQIIFKGNAEKLYDYKTDLQLEKGEPVVVPTGSGFSVGTVYGVLADSKKATAWVVQKVDAAGHEQRMKKRELEELEALLL